MNDLENGYWCVICGRFLPAEEYDDVNIIVHDDVPHPAHLSFDEEQTPQ